MFESSYRTLKIWKATPWLVQQCQNGNFPPDKSPVLTRGSSLTLIPDSVAVPDDTSIRETFEPSSSCGWKKNKNWSTFKIKASRKAVAHAYMHHKRQCDECMSKFEGIRLNITSVVRWELQVHNKKRNTQSCYYISQCIISKLILNITCKLTITYRSMSITDY